MMAWGKSREIDVYDEETAYRKEAQRLAKQACEDARRILDGIPHTGKEAKRERRRLYSKYLAEAREAFDSYDHTDHMRSMAVPEDDDDYEEVEPEVSQSEAEETTTEELPDRAGGDPECHKKQSFSPPRQPVNKTTNKQRRRLTKEEVLAIRSDAAEGVPPAKLAEIHDVSVRTARGIVARTMYLQY